jgi:hypothetical protein
MAGESDRRRYEIVVLVCCTSTVEGPYLVEFEYEMSMFDDSVVLDYLTPAEELGVLMVLETSDQWEAMDIAERRVQKALRRLALINCRTKIVYRQRLR